MLRAEGVRERRWGRLSAPRGAGWRGGEGLGKDPFVTSCLPSSAQRMFSGIPSWLPLGGPAIRPPPLPVCPKLSKGRAPPGPYPDSPGGLAEPPFSSPHTARGGVGRKSWCWGGSPRPPHCPPCTGPQVWRLRTHQNTPLLRVGWQQGGVPGARLAGSHGPEEGDLCCGGGAATRPAPRLWPVPALFSVVKFVLLAGISMKGKGRD